MGQKLFEIFELVGQEGGLPAKMRMAMITGIPSAKAKTQPDTPELIKKFSAAYKEIAGKDCPVS